MSLSEVPDALVRAPRQPVRSTSIALLPGDGIGAEVIPQAARVLEAVAGQTGQEITFRELPVGGSSIEALGSPITDGTIEACMDSDAVLLGAVGGPAWDSLPLQQRPERALLVLRKELGCYANLRPIWLPKCLATRTPLRPELVAGGIDIMIVRELAHGLYYGDRGRRTRADGVLEAYDTAVYTAEAVRQVGRLAFELARSRRGSLMSLDKSNILETSRLWREVMDELSADFDDVRLRHQLIDSGAMVLLLDPSSFDVIATNNEFGDIISDEASVLGGSLGMIPSASLGESRPYLFEPIHGSAPDIAGQGIANPLGAVLAGAMLLAYGLGAPEGARQIRRAVESALEAGCRTRDLVEAGHEHVSTAEMTDEIIARL